MSKAILAIASPPGPAAAALLAEMLAALARAS